MPKSPGFTLIEIVIAILIIGIITAVAVPVWRSSGDQRAPFINQLNYLLQITWQDTVVTNKTHRVLFDAGKKKIIAETMTGDPMVTDMAKAGESSKFQAISGKYYQADVAWDPEKFVLQDFYVGAHNILKKATGNQPAILLYPDGLVQPVTINLSDDKAENFSLVLNPFLAQFEEHDAHQMPK